MNKNIENLDKIIRETAKKIDNDLIGIVDDFNTLKNEFISIIEKSFCDPKEPEEITYKWGDKIKLSGGQNAIFLRYFSFDSATIVVEGMAETSIVYKSTIVKIVE